MAFILSIETSTPVSSIAIHSSGELLAQQSIHINKSHAQYLVPSIKNLCEMCGVRQSDIKGVAVSEGPGSYTGLRIGTSSAKGLCYALDIPLMAINTLEAMAAGIAPFIEEDVLLCPMLDARRMEVYCLIADCAGAVVQQTKAEIIDSDSFNDHLDKSKMIFFGNGAQKCKPVLEHHQNAIFIDDVYPSAVQIGKLAWVKFQAQQFEDLAYFEPYYLKDFIAKKPSARKLV